MRAVIDIDGYKYKAAFAGETRRIRAVEIKSGVERVFPTRTDFYGHWIKKSGGWLGTYNQDAKNILTPEDFTILDEQIPDTIDNVQRTVRVMIEEVLAKSKASSYIAFLGKGESFRVERSTILKYKGNRADTLKPIHLEAITDYIHKKYKAEYITGIEADDRCVMEAYQRPDHFVISQDKDMLGCDINLFNTGDEEAGIVDCSGFGELYINAKNEVKGRGRMWLMHQVMSGDSSDNYTANSASNTKWGEKASYKLLSSCKTDKELWEAAVKGYKHLYPEPVEVVGWRGDKITVDWLYMFEENWDLARMLRWDGDSVKVEDVLSKLRINTDDV